MMHERTKKILTWGLALLALYLIFSLVSGYFDQRQRWQAKQPPPNRTSEQEAINKARAFCTATGIVCSGEITVANTGKATMPGIVNHDDLRKWHLDLGYGSPNESYSHYYGAYITFEDTNIKDRDGIPPYIILGLGRYSNKIESYGNPMRYFELSRKYGHLKKSKEIPDGRFEYSPFISQQMAVRIVNSLTPKVGLPSDMLLEKIEKNMEDGVWNAIWLRKKNGFLYEGDGAIMSISGVTGELLSYKQKYQGVGCPIDHKISRDRALELAWKKLHWKNPLLIFWNAKDVYEVKADLRIVPTGIFLDKPVPIKFTGSRLAWIVTLKFTGGLKFDEDKRTALHLAGNDRPYKQYLDEKNAIWKRMLYPTSMFEVRIDAINGSYIYADKVEPLFSRWFLR